MNKKKESKVVPNVRFKGFTDDWKQRKLGELGAITTGNTPSTSVSEYYSDDGMIWVTPTDISNNITYETEKKLSKLGQQVGRVVPKNTILVTCIASIGKNTMLGKSGSFNQQINGLTPNEIKYVPYFLFTESTLWSAQMKKSAAAGTMQIVNRTEFSELKTWIPTYEEQKKIGAYFANLDRLITLHQQKITLLIKLKKAMLEKMFPKKGSVIPEFRFNGFANAWEQRKFEDMVVRSSEISSETILPRVEYEDIISGTGCLNKNIFDKESCKNGIIFHKGDVLYGKLRPYLQNWLLPSFKGLAVGDFWVLKPQNVDSSFLYILIQSRKFDEIANQSTGTKMPRADWNLVSKSKFFIPSTVDEQANIGTYFKRLDNLITLHQRKIDKIKNMKKVMLDQMFI